MTRFLFLFVFVHIAYGKPLRPVDITKSVEQSYPLILEARFKELMAKMDLRSSKGAFDLRLQGETDVRLDGYYDGEAYSAKLVKPFRNFNSKLYAGYRVSDGSFPIYEGKRETLDDGEYLFGLEFSLLRDRYMHSKMFKEVLSELKLQEASNKLEVVKMNIKHDALVTFWNWVVAGKTFKIYSELLNAAELRQEGLKKRSKRGDLAKIRVVENMQYITERRSQKVKALQNFQNLSQELALFYRDSSGKPVMVDEDFLPEILWDDFLAQLDNNLKLKEEKLLDNPKFQNFANWQEQIRSAIELHNNSLLPKLDFKIESSRDKGAGSTTLEGRENRVMLTLEIPIERNLGKGAVQREKAKIKMVQNAQKFQQEVTLTKAQILKNKIFANKEIIKNVIQEVDFADKLLKAELSLFASGSSDYFVLNLREQSLAKAKIKQLESFFNYKRSVVEINNLYWNL